MVPTWFKDLPPWVQAAGAVGALVVTWQLARLTAKYVSTTENIAKATNTQVEQALALASAAQRGVAKALLEEVRRIRSELGPPPRGEVRPIATGGIPELLSWMEPVIPQIAQTDPQVVAGFMKLDRSLGNLRLVTARFKNARDANQTAQAEREHAETAHDNREDNLAMGLEALDLPEMLRVADVAEQNLTKALADAELSYAICHEVLDGLEARLVAAST